jgi:hypothetical protein
MAAPKPRWPNVVVVVGVSVAFIGVWLAGTESLRVLAIVLTVAGAVVSSTVAVWDDLGCRTASRGSAVKNLSIRGHTRT